MTILGIETSCDETAAAVAELREDGPCTLLSNVVLSSMDLHAAYGGVVPEIAARSHIEAITPVIQQALEQAACNWDNIDAIAVTYGAGLGGSLLIGVLTARTLAITKKKPLYACNHVEGHIYANFLTKIGSNFKYQTSNIKPPSTFHLPPSRPSFPMLGLIVSGGHSQLVLWRNHFDYTLLGQTQDDAIGEAFDKVAKILGLPYPGGPSIGIAAEQGNSFAFDFPKAKMTSVSPALEELRAQGSGRITEKSPAHPSALTPRPSLGYDFSFSGIKTAVLRAAQAAIGENYAFPSHKLPERLSEAQKADIAASFQRVAIETVVDKTIQAYEEFKPKSVVIGGGVAASPELRRQLQSRLNFAIRSDLIAKEVEVMLKFQDQKLMTDNGAMIAALGCYKMLHMQPIADPYTLSIEPNLSM